MTDTDKLEPGWYWVKWEEGDDWHVAQLDKGYGWWRFGVIFTRDAPAIIGPRLTPPEGSS